ncbi:MBL fold metallo-hydrolase [Paludifilum halophilum]|uniref:MBL fold metallo-hydrolase n=1 Tax=Paludifilum halophilum TaxID=1642702 RepID=UPI001F0B5774|nr:MBL fold metallo-hydrolase [Paludifilum halophilum]
MRENRLEDLGYGIRLIDGYDLNVPDRTGIYVLEEEELTLVETSTSQSVSYILKGLEELGRSPEEIRNIIVTHIHLDHAGGVGLLLKHCPRARVIVHPRGARHLADPSRLIRGARAVYGSSFDDLFDPVLPVPEDRILVKGEGETLAIGSERTLTFMDTPGHAAHHLSIFDPVSNGVFTGDTVGIRYPQVEKWGLNLYLPSTSPNQFDPELMRSSIERLRSTGAERIYFGHFGMAVGAKEVYNRVLQELSRFLRDGEEAIEGGEGAKGIEWRLKERYHQYLSDHGIPGDHPVFETLDLDCRVSAMGIEHYLTKQRMNS